MLCLRALAKRWCQTPWATLNSLERLRSYYSFRNKALKKDRTAQRNWTEHSMNSQQKRISGHFVQVSKHYILVSCGWILGICVRWQRWIWSTKRHLDGNGRHNKLSYWVLSPMMVSSVSIHILKSAVLFSFLFRSSWGGRKKDGTTFCRTLSATSHGTFWEESLGSQSTPDQWIALLHFVKNWSVTEQGCIKLGGATTLLKETKS